MKVLEKWKEVLSNLREQVVQTGCFREKERRAVKLAYFGTGLVSKPERMVEGC